MAYFIRDGFAGEPIYLVKLMYFNTRQLSAISISAVLWAVINALVGPMFWNMTHLPVLCDMLGVATLSLILWWTRKPGASVMVGAIATLVTFMVSPGSVQFLGFTVACIVFEVFTLILGYERVLGNNLLGWGLLLFASFISTVAAGVVIGIFFMNPGFLASAFGGLAFFAGLHGLGGVIGGVLGVVIVKSLMSRGIQGF